MIAKLTSILTTAGSFLFALSKTIKKWTDFLKEQTEIYADEIKMVQESAAMFQAHEGTPFVDDLEAPEDNPHLKKEEDLLKELQEKEKEAAKIKSRLSVLAGDSFQNLVEERSEKYESMLGVLHAGKKDLDALKDAMFNKYHDAREREKTFPRGKPRIVLFLEDLDRCDPEKVVDVLEALQLLVKSKLFVVVAAIDLQYLCSTLEKKRYEHILHSHKCPTGLDYLEKIFQLGYRVPATISKENMKNYIDSLMPDCVGAWENSEESNYTVQWLNKDGSKIEKNNDKKRSEEVLHTSYLHEPTQDDITLLKEACTLFQLTARATKRIMNVFRLINEIGILKGKKLEPDLKRHNLLLLVMAASGETKIGIQNIFTMMEKTTMPTFPSGSASPKDLSELVKDQCSAIGNDIIFQYIEELNTYTFDDRNKWRAVSENFDLARSFSFFREAQEEEGRFETLVEALMASSNKVRSKNDTAQT